MWSWQDLSRWWGKLTGAMPARDDDYFQLRAERIVMTADLVAERVSCRLPGRGLVGVAEAVRKVAGESAWRTREVKEPVSWMRWGCVMLGLSMVAMVIKVVTLLRFDASHAWDVLSGIEAGISSVIYLGLAMVFLITLEQRVRRRRALAAVQELRALAHVIDMHQLAKDPERLVPRYAMGDEHSPGLTDHATLGRYLDYCTDLLAIVGKVAALYGNNMQDPVVLAAVDEIEQLTTGVSRKIWQKIMVLDQIIASEQERPRVIEA